MQTMQLFSHSVRMVLNNLGPAFRVSTPLIAIMVLSYLLLGGESASYSGDFSFEGGDMEGEFTASAAASTILQILASLWVAVAWHRYILLEETPSGYIPAFRGDRVLSYFLRGLLLFVIVVVAAFALGFIGVFMIALETAITGVIGAVMIGVMVVAIIVISARLYVILPAAAVDRELPLREAWNATEGMTIPIVVAYVLLVLCLMVGGFVLGLVSIFTGFVGVLLLIVFNAVATLFGLSFLTTIYGVAIEGRSID